MNIKEIFEKATSENKSLTYEEFEELAKAGKCKFTDLAEGHYVSKQKYDDDISTRDTQISSLNDTLTSRDTDLASLKEKLQAAGGDAEKLEKLNTDFSTLQSKYEADTAALQSKLQSQAYEFAVRDFANSQKFSSNAAKRDFINTMVQKNLPMENGNIMGAKDFMGEYAKENKDAFFVDTKPATPAEPKPQFASPAPGDNKGGSKMSLSELMRMKNENPNATISFD